MRARRIRGDVYGKAADGVVDVKRFWVVAREELGKREYIAYELWLKRAERVELIALEMGLYKDEVEGLIRSARGKMRAVSDRYMVLGLRSRGRKK